MSYEQYAALRRLQRELGPTRYALAWKLAQALQRHPWLRPAALWLGACFQPVLVDARPAASACIRGQRYARL